jgi:hypothetical protein
MLHMVGNVQTSPLEKEANAISPVALPAFRLVNGDDARFPSLKFLLVFFCWRIAKAFFGLVCEVETSRAPGNDANTNSCPSFG